MVQDGSLLVIGFKFEKKEFFHYFLCMNFTFLDLLEPLFVLLLEAHKPLKIDKCENIDKIRETKVFNQSQKNNILVSKRFLRYPFFKLISLSILSCVLHVASLSISILIVI